MIEDRKYCGRCAFGDLGPSNYEHWAKERVRMGEIFVWRCTDCKRELVEASTVDRPEHYKFGSLEAIDIIKEAVPDFSSYCEGNVLKYMLRYRKKNGKEDLMKAAKYLEWLIENEN